MDRLPRIDKQSATPLVEQIATFFRGEIDARRLAAGARLPTIRAVADHAGVTRTTVQQAYRRLADAGLVEATVGRGTTVTGRAPSGSEDASRAAALGPISRAARDAFAYLRGDGQPAPREASSVPPAVADFGGLLPDATRFPVAAFEEALTRALAQRGHELLAYSGDPAGSPELRELLAARHTLGGDACGADDLVITSGAQQGIDLVLRTLCEPGDAVALPVPTYHQLFGMLRAQGLEPVPVATRGDDGIDLRDLGAALRRPDVRACYLMPTFHNPTGRTLDRAQREALVDVLADSDVPVIEDEFEAELRFAGEPLPTLRRLDPRRLTVTVRTFSKGLFPGVRIGWVQGPAAILGPLTAMKRFADLETSPLLQAGLAEFVTAGAMDRYLEDLRGALARRHAAAVATLREHAPSGCRWTEPEGGFALWLELPTDVDADAVVERAAAAGVRATSGRLFDPFRRRVGALRLSLSCCDEATVTRGLEILCGCIDELVDAAATRTPTPLIL